ncbi:MAG: hypothetical protein H7263_13335 [Candidatus Sericytochromatia bacterium]|nr:hypothetical protein [Candidatus Sericytochromatia bacterium]
MIVVKHQWKPLENFLCHDVIMTQTPPKELITYITALAIKDSNYKTRSAQEKLITGTLKKYYPTPPGRTCDSQLPQLELFRLGKNGRSRIDMFEEDRQAVYNILISQGWVVNNSLADQDKKWTYEQWAIEPFQDSKIPLGDKSFTDVDFIVW